MFAKSTSSVKWDQGSPREPSGPPRLIYGQVELAQPTEDWRQDDGRSIVRDRPRGLLSRLANRSDPTPPFPRTGAGRRIARPDRSGPIGRPPSNARRVERRQPTEPTATAESARAPSDRSTTAFTPNPMATSRSNSPTGVEFETATRIGCFGQTLAERSRSSRRRAQPDRRQRVERPGNRTPDSPG